MTNAPTLFPTVAESTNTGINFFIYYRKPDGWITPNPGHAQAHASRVRRGWEPLAKYGSYVPGELSRDARDIPFNASREGWKVGFQSEHDFASEFKLEQIIAMGWHIQPPYREVVFPQLDGLDIENFECPECVRIPFNRATDLATHLKISHDYSRVDIKVYGDEIDVDFTQKAAREAVAELQKQAERNLKASGYETATAGCDWPGCEWAPGTHVKDTSKSLATHRRFKHERTRVPEEESALEGSESNG